jgi:hypothetical protein
VDHLVDIGTAAQEEAVPAFDKDHLIAAVPAYLTATLDPGAQAAIAAIRA